MLITWFPTPRLTKPSHLVQFHRIPSEFSATNNKKRKQFHDVDPIIFFQIGGPNRRLVIEENLQFVKADKKKKHFRRFWLFSDALLITKEKKKDVYWVIRFIPIDYVNITDPDPSST